MLLYAWVVYRSSQEISGQIMFHTGVIVALRLVLVVGKCRLDRNNTEAMSVKGLGAVIVINLVGVLIAVYLKAIVDEYLLAKYYGFRVEVSSKAITHNNTISTADNKGTNPSEIDNPGKNR